MDTAKYHYPHHHKSGWMWLHIGSVITVAQRKFYRVLVDAGTKPENFCHSDGNIARDEHEWEDRKCDFHSHMLCSCGQHGEGDVKSKGKAYKTRNVLICPYHSLAYQIECETTTCTYIPMCGWIKGTSSHCKCDTAPRAKLRACISL